MNVSFRFHNGEKVTLNAPRDVLIERLDTLDRLEREARKYAPTDSGLTRINAQIEANAIRKVVFNL